MSTSTVVASTSAQATSRRTSLSVTISAWAVPLLFVGDFALLAVVPLVLVLVGVLRHSRLRGLRGPAGVLATVYAIPLAIWLLNPDRPESLSKDIDPVFVGLVAAASAVVLLKLHTRKR